MRNLGHIPALFWTLLIFIAFEVFSSTFLMALGVRSINFSIIAIIILFLAFYVQGPATPVYALIFQWVHSLFTIQGWALGTLVSIFFIFSISYLKELLSFSSYVSNVVLVFCCQLVWHLVHKLVLALKGVPMNLTSDLFALVFESLILALIAPFLFHFFGRVWSSSIAKLKEV